MKDEVRRQVDAALKPIVRRLVAAMIIVTIFAVGGAAFGAYLAEHAQHADQARGVRLGIADCHRSQEGRRALALIVHTAVPRHAPGRTKAEQAFFDAFYKKVAPALKVPTCS
jgi:uncharacterized membrane protein